MTIENSNTARYLNFDEDGIPIVQAKHMRNGELQVIASKSPVNNLAQLESNSVREVCLDF